MYKQYFLKSLVFIFLFCSLQTSFARHIVGGVVYYECLGGGTYRFLVKMYRDCEGNGANFDDPAAISIYGGQGANTLVANLNVPLSPTIIDIPPDLTDPCLELPPNVCVEEGIYEFTYTFANWPASTSYHISYQRCCRNNTISNIVDPNNTGATFTVELTPASQAVCNNSPVFDNFPPLIICAGEPISFDHSATDAEGDQIVYELCAPFSGGGNPGGGGGGGNCNSVIPDPACPPPYSQINFLAPQFSSINPLGTTANIQIDPFTGLLTGTPNALGQYVVGICMKEFRNGILLSEVRREFQFNVGNCTPFLTAIIEADSIANDTAIYVSCNELDFDIVNMSFNAQNVNSFRWEFDFPNGIQTINTWNAAVMLPDTGIYNGRLLLNPGELCGDTAYVRLISFPTTVPAISYKYDTCLGGPVQFVNESFFPSAPLDSIFWDFGDGTTSNDFAPFHRYDTTSNFSINIYMVDENGCATTSSQNVIYFPVPDLVIVSPDDTLSCPPATINFRNLSNPVDESYTVEWDFGDGTTDESLFPSHVYNTKGTYSVRVKITSPIGCVTDTTFENLIRITDPPIADFNVLTQDITQINNRIEIEDASKFAVHWDWYWDEQRFSTQTDPTYTARDTGLHELKLVITHPEFCQDSITKIVDVRPEVRFFLPNAFTPDEDSENEFFKGTGVLPNISGYQMQVWNRYGQVVFESQDPTLGWNGLMKNEGDPLTIGVYVYEVQFTGPRGEPFYYKGTLQLIR